MGAEKGASKWEKRNGVGPVWSWKSLLSAWGGGSAATILCHPIDIVKVRRQLGAAENAPRIAREIVRSDGLGGLYRGWSAAITRQVVYTSLRISSYNSIVIQLRELHPLEPVPMGEKAAAGLLAAGVGAAISTPADLSLVRMQADGMLPAQQRRHYAHVGDVVSRVLREEGVRGLYRGGSATALRAVTMNAGMLISNEQLREVVINAGAHPKSMSVVIGAAGMSGVVGAMISAPFDYVKTQLQVGLPGAAGGTPYKGTWDCLVRTVHEQGPQRLFRGFHVYLARITPHAMMTIYLVKEIAAHMGEDVQ